MGKKYTVAIIGLGGRGMDSYGYLINKDTEHYDIISLCDLREEWLNRAGERFGVDKSERFLSEEAFFEKKRADILVIATPDNCHTRHLLKAFALGYDVLVEKPLTDKREECLQLLEAQKKYGNKALVCHVLRYAPAFVKAKEILQSGAIGKLVSIDALERVGYWHQAHSYVRGNWRSSTDSTPMILAKCCHDLDLLQYYAASKCKSISSVGDLAYFKAENAPENATKRCTDCPAETNCPYSAQKIYIKRWYDNKAPEDGWPYNILVSAPVTEEKLKKAIQDGPYGRCVFHCDNDVVDHQQTTMTFENGVTATLTMTAFTHQGGRRISFYGTLGELVLDEEYGHLSLKVYGKPIENLPLSDLVEKGYGHGGGDQKIIQNLYPMLEGKTDQATSLEASIESHLMGICAEESRLQGGALIYIHN